MLSSSQLSILRYHSDAGDRIAYYTALADFGIEYGRLALEVVLNATVSGVSANSYFLDQAGEEGQAVTNNTLATISLALMQADFARRDRLNGADLTVDDIQRYHQDVFRDIADVSADAWTPNMYLDTFEAFEDRQAAWDSMLNSSAAWTAGLIQARHAEVIQNYIEENPSVTVPVGTILTSTLQELLSFGIDSVFANWILSYSAYLVDLTNAGVGSFFFVSPNGPYQVGISQAGNMIGGNGGDNTLIGTADDDVMNGQAGDDTFIGGDGADRYHGGSGEDTADYSFESSGIIIQLGALQGGTADEWAAINEVSVVQRIRDGEGNWDFAIGVEKIVGTVHDDRVSFFGAADDYFNEDDVDTLLQGGGNTDLGDVLDFSALKDVPSGLTAIWDASGTINFNTGSWAAAGAAEDFEAVIGSSGNDSITGDDQANGINGHLGADVLIGGGGDDFIFFDAADGANVDGGAGWDVAVALGSDGVTVDMAAQGLECVIGCDGADTITVAGIAPGPDELLHAAGGGGSDTFIVTHNPGEGPKVLWGGAGADHFDFRLTDPDYSRDQLGIAVVHIEGLTEEAFSRLTLANLGLGGIDISKLDAIIINPDGLDSYFWGGAPLTTSNIDLLDYDDVGYYSHFVSGYDTPASFEVRSSSYLGGTQSIQSVFSNEIRVQHELTFNFDYLDITVWSGGDYEVAETETYNERPYESLQAAIDEAKFIAELEFEQYAPYSEYGTTPEYWTMTYHETDSDVPHYYAPFFVVGGTFSGGDLSANGQLISSLPDDSGPSAFDWLLAA